MRLHHLRLLLATFSIVFLGDITASADSLTYTFSTDPLSGIIQGVAGSTIGWGYSITNNDSTDWLVITDLNSDPFADGVPDASLFDFPIVAPGTTVSESYDPVADTGLFALTWDASAPIGFTNSGVFTIDAEWWSGDPSAGGTFIEDAAEETAAYSASVSSPSTSLPDEASPFPMLAIVVLVLLGLFKSSRIRAL